MWPFPETFFLTSYHSLHPTTRWPTTSFSSMNTTVFSFSESLHTVFLLLEMPLSFLCLSL